MRPCKHINNNQTKAYCVACILLFLCVINLVGEKEIGGKKNRGKEEDAGRVKRKWAREM